MGSCYNIFMLEELSVRNYALIDNLNLNFEKGLNIITGETGAGKSIIVGSLSFLLGAKADAGCIRTGAEEAGVNAVIFIDSAHTEARAWLGARDIQIEDERVIVRRSLKSSGRGSIFIQNVPATRSDLSEFMALLFDIHGQHDHESLLRRDTHRKYLDRFAGIEAEVAEFTQIFNTLTEKRKNIEAAEGSTREREARIELLSFAADEIEKARLKNGESRDLEAEASRLASFEKLAAFIETASLAFFEDGASVLSLTRRARAALESAAALDGSLSPLEQRLSNLFYEADDIAAELRLYRDSLSFDPSRQETVEERLSFIQKLKKKYVKTALVEGGEKSFTTVEDAILAYRDEALAEIEALSASDENREKLKNEVIALEKEIALKARSISAKRLAASSNLSAMISAVLRRLGMNAAKFSVRLAPKTPEGAGRMLLGPYGADDVEFLFSANAGEPEKELARIASGGELSRVMLAIKATLASGGLNNAEKPEKSELFPGALNTTAAQKSDSSPDTLIFDEIDTGIGGEVAIAVGEELTRISKGKQVFCITHIASIAARAAHHILVEKASDGRRTVTTVRSLSGEARRAEIARLLAGSKDETALAHAGELLAKWAV